jgi:ATP-binding cassette, subfamily F, member 3
VLYRLDKIRVEFAGRVVLHDLSLQHNPGEKLVLLGRNGSGKTTLLRVIAGELVADEGVVERARDLVVARLEQQLEVPAATPVLDWCLEAFPGLLAAERELEALAPALERGDEGSAARFHELQDVLERLDGSRCRPRARSALQGLGVPPELHARPLEHLSGGERTRVALARALLSPASLLLLDEPTNHLDLVGTEYLAAELEKRTGGLLLVTHDRDLVDRVGGGIVELQGGSLQRYGGGYARYRRERAQRRLHGERAWKLQQAEIARQEEFVRRNIAGQNTRQAQARQKLLDRLERLPAPEPDLEPIKLRWPDAQRSGDRVLAAEGVTFGHDRPLGSDVTITLRRGDRLVIVGRNGAGKTTLLMTLAGRIPQLAGVIRLGSGVVPGSYDQDHAALQEEASVLEVVLAARPDWTPAESRGWSGRFGFSGEAAEASTASLSGGERARLALAALIARGPNLMLLDEPTNHLDIPTCEVLEDALLQFPGALVLVTHDRRLAERVATSVLLLSEGAATPVNRVEDAFAALGMALSSAGRSASGGTAPRRSPLEEERRRLRRDSGRARAEADRLAASLASAEGRLREIDDLLCQSEVFGDPWRAAALGREGDEIRAALDSLIDTWSVAEEDAEALESRLAELEES